MHTFAVAGSAGPVLRQNSTQSLRSSWWASGALKAAVDSRNPGESVKNSPI